MTYDNELTLIAQTFTDDGLGQEIPSETAKTILACEKSVGRSEFYSAGKEGFKLEAILTVHKFEYNGERVVEYNGKRHSVIRTYGVNNEEVELTIGEVTNR